MEFAEEMFATPADLDLSRRTEADKKTVDGGGGGGAGDDAAPLPVDLVCNGVWKPVQQVPFRFDLVVLANTVRTSTFSMHPSVLGQAARRICVVFPPPSSKQIYPAITGITLHINASTTRNPLLGTCTWNFYGVWGR